MMNLAIPMRRAAAVTAALLLAPVTAVAQPTAEPWLEPQDTTATMFETDKYAWRVFVALNWPANVSQKAPDPSKRFGADGPVVWETWRSAFQSAPDTMFPTNGSDPGDWLGPRTAGPAVAGERRFDSVLRQQRMFAAVQTMVGGRARVGMAPRFEAETAAAFGHEVRLNKSVYDFVRSNTLYNREGQMAAAAAGKPILNFPPNSKAIKAVWRQIGAADKPRYHWTEVKADSGPPKIWGLTALHITTKDIPNWLWATFEHIDNKPERPPRPDHGDEPVFEGWKNPSVDRAACPAPPHNCEAIPAGFGLEGTKWANYRLRGTQIDFVDSIGFPVILSSSEQERGFQRSSCMTCHADATINKDGQGLPFVVSIGSPDSNKFRDPRTGQRLFMQLDFLWSLQRAASRS